MHCSILVYWVLLVLRYCYCGMGAEGYNILTFYRFLFVVEMEMTILGSRHFLIITTQNGSKSPKLRYCVVEKFLSSLEDFFLLNIDDVWKSVVIGVLTPSRFISCHAYFCF